MPRLSPVAITSPIMQQKMGDFLRGKNEKIYLIYQIALQTGIPVTLLLKKHIKDIRDKESIEYTIRTNNCSVPFNRELKRELSAYCSGKKNDDWLFPGKDPGQPYPLLSVQRAISSATKQLGLSDVTIGSIRKTFLYNEYHSGAITLQQLISKAGHPSPEQLLRCYNIDYQYPKPDKESDHFDDETLAELFLKMDQVKHFLMSKGKIDALPRENFNEICNMIYNLDSTLYSWQKYIK